jgi:uncharacterized phage protein (TIGR01671 family)
MRELKFRAWIEREKYMATQGEPDLETLGSFMHHYSDNSILMQYTGLKDKKGKDIYEGDVDKYGNVVGFCEKTASFQFFIYDFPTKEKIACNCFNCEGNFNFTDGDIEITGNIYENQGLL